MTSKYEALKSLIECQKDVLKFNQNEDFDEIPKHLQKNIAEHLQAIEKLIEINLSKQTGTNKFKQKLTYSQEGFMIRQPANGGSYMLWSGTTDGGVQCGIGFDADNAGYVDADLFLAETRDSSGGNNKDIDMYIFADPYTEDYTDYRNIAFADLKEALELD